MIFPIPTPTSEVGFKCAGPAFSSLEIIDISLFIAGTQRPTTVKNVAKLKKAHLFVAVLSPFFEATPAISGLCRTFRKQAPWNAKFHCNINKVNDLRYDTL